MLKRSKIVNDPHKYLVLFTYLSWRRMCMIRCWPRPAACICRFRVVLIHYRFFW